MPRKTEIKFTELDDLIEYACRYNGESREYECDIAITVDGVIYETYAVSICNRDLLFYSSNATLNYLIDNINGSNEMSLVSIDE